MGRNSDTIEGYIKASGDVVISSEGYSNSLIDGAFTKSSIIDIITSNLTPGDVFYYDALAEWAIDNGFIEENFIGDE
jgi:hypothetical protein